MCRAAGDVRLSRCPWKEERALHTHIKLGCKELENLIPMWGRAMPVPFSCSSPHSAHCLRETDYFTFMETVVIFMQHGKLPAPQIPDSRPSPW